MGDRHCSSKLSRLFLFFLLAPSQIFSTANTNTKGSARKLLAPFGNEECEEIRVPICQGIGYNYTKVPYAFNYNSQEEIAMEVRINSFYFLNSALFPGQIVFSIYIVFVSERLNNLLYQEGNDCFMLASFNL